MNDKFFQLPEEKQTEIINAGFLADDGILEEYIFTKKGK